MEQTNLLPAVRRQIRAFSLASAPLAALLLAAGGAAWAQEAPAACGAGEPAATQPATAVCAVCGPREKSGPEPVAASLAHQGKTYYFCQEACKTEFQQDPEKWIKLAHDAGQGREGVTRPKTGDETGHQHAPQGTSPAGGARGGSAAPS